MAEASPALVAATDPDCFGATPLIRAVGTGHRTMVDLLLDLGADINQRSQWWAGSFGVLDSANDEMSEYLLERGALLTPHAAARLGKIDQLRAMLDSDSSVVHARGGDGQTPLHFARTVEVAQLLLSRGAGIDALDVDHASTPAQWLGESRPEVAAHLVTRGAAADPFLAARTGDTLLLERLVGAEPDGVGVRVTRARFPAAPPAAGHIYIYTIGEGCGLVHAAVKANQPVSIRWLAAHGADVNARGGYDDATPLHVAAWGDKPEAAGALLDCGADINAKSGPMHRNEPVGWAVVAGSVSTLRVLVGRGAALHAHHMDDARKGAQGAFREFNPRRPLDAWRQIADALSQR
jgi:ankyrin repeat protein